jgi:hypothetical protein
MAQTLQSQVIGLANQMNGIAAQLVGLQALLTAINEQWSALDGQTVMNAMGTCAQNADGSIGAADSSPTTGHPINPATYPTLNRATSAYNYGATLTVLQQLLNLLNGAAVTQQTTAPTILAEMTGG